MQFLKSVWHVCSDLCNWFLLLGLQGSGITCNVVEIGTTHSWSDRGGVTCVALPTYVHNTEFGVGQSGRWTDLCNGRNGHSTS